MLEAKAPAPKPDNVQTSTKSNADYVIGDVVWHRQQGNDILNKFRNYEL